MKYWPTYIYFKEIKNTKALIAGDKKQDPEPKHRMKLLAL